VIRTAQELTSDWLATAIGAPGAELLAVDPIGTGQLSQSLRVTYRGADGADGSVVVKLASADPTSRGTGVGMGAYFREISFYRSLAARIVGPVPACHLAEYDAAEGFFTLVLEDIAGASQGDQIDGCTIDEAALALRALAEVHAPVLGDLVVGMADWLNLPNPLNQDLLTMLLPAFLDRYGERIRAEHVAVCERFVPSIDGWAGDRRPPLGLVHGDYRLDNLLFGDATCTVVDWQTVTWGPAMSDVSYFIGSGLSVEDRRAAEEQLVRLYHGELVRQGIREFGWEQCWEGYRRQSFGGILMIMAASMVVQRTDRGDDMFMAWLERAAQQVLDLDALSLLPAPRAGRPPALRPDPEDEGCHDPGPEQLWNESWYFDAVGDDGDLGVYVRLGRLPNQGVALYTASVCGPGRPTLMLVEAAAPLPPAEDETQAVALDGLRAAQHCESPLQRFRVTLEGTAQAHADPSAPLRGEPGEPVALGLDLVWETDGIPYAWRQSTRYEIPCRVSGTVTIDGESVALSGPGQRDHSWGARDWWAVDWMWNGLHLDDGTHLHAVGVPQVPGRGVGYVQRGDTLDELDAVTTSETVAENGLITAATVTCGPPELVLTIEPLAFGALRLEAPDGRLSLFPRAMCRVRTGDGRTGSGWIEWNRVQRP
jgi:hypothetical protein